MADLTCAKEYNIPQLISEIVETLPEFIKVGEIYAEGGRSTVLTGLPQGIKTFDPPTRIRGRTIVKELAAPQSLADLFHRDNLTVAGGTENLELLNESLEQVSFCFGRGSLVKLLEAANVNMVSHFKKDFELRLTRSPDSQYFIVEDTEQWIISPEFGHGAANFVTTTVEGYGNWYHYVYHMVKLQSGDDEIPLSILLRNEVDAVKEEEDEYLHVEIKSHNCRYSPDMTHYAYCVLTGQTAGLYVIARRPMGNLSSIESAKLYDREYLKSQGRKEEYLNSLGVVKLLLTSVLTELNENNVNKAFLKYTTPLRNGQPKIVLKY